MAGYAPLKRYTPKRYDPSISYGKSNITGDELKLTPRQIPHADRLLHITTFSNYYWDTSKPGSGKTYIAAVLSKILGLPLFIICPNSVQANWRRIIDEYSLDHVALMSYNILQARAAPGDRPGAERLVQSPNGAGVLTTWARKVPTYGPADVGDEEESSYTVEPSAEFQKEARDGILLVIDECQNIKNPSEQTRTAQALTRACRGTESVVGFLSGSPYDKESHAVQFLRAMGIINHRRLITTEANVTKYIGYGIGELILEAERYDKKRMDEIMKEMPPNISNQNKFCFTVLTQIFRAFTGSHALPPEINTIADNKNGYYLMDPYNQAQLVSGIDKLRRAAGVVMRGDEAIVGKVHLGDIQHALRQIELAKVGIMASLAHGYYSHPAMEGRSKIIIGVNYYETIDKLVELLSRVGIEPKLLTGSVGEKRRDAIIQEFNTDPDTRFIIMMTAVGGIGINLHDKSPGGTYPRFTILAPNYNLEKIYQASLRIRREGTTSNTTVRIVYGNVQGEGDINGKLETRVLSALAKKSEVMKKMVGAGLDIELPESYMTETEVRKPDGTIEFVISEPKDVKVLSREDLEGLGGELGDPDDEEVAEEGKSKAKKGESKSRAKKGEGKSRAKKASKKEPSPPPTPRWSGSYPSYTPPSPGAGGSYPSYTPPSPGAGYPPSPGAGYPPSPGAGVSYPSAPSYPPPSPGAGVSYPSAPSYPPPSPGAGVSYPSAPSYPGVGVSYPPPSPGAPSYPPPSPAAGVSYPASGYLAAPSQGVGGYPPPQPGAARYPSVSYTDPSSGTGGYTSFPPGAGVYRGVSYSDPSGIGAGPGAGYYGYSKPPA